MPARINQQPTQEQQYDKQVKTADVLLAMLKYLRPDSVEDNRLFTSSSLVQSHAVSHRRLSASSADGKMR